MSISAYTFTANSIVSNTALVKNGAKLKVAKGERYRFVDANGNPPAGLQITQVGKDAKVEWLDEDSPRGGKSFLTLENFNTTADVAISAPGITPAQVQGLNLASDTSLITSTNTLPADLASSYVEPTLTGAAVLGASWWMGAAGLVLAGAAGGGGSSPPADTTPPAAPLVTTAPAALSNNTHPVIAGTAEAGSTVTVIVGGATYTTTASPTGAWSVNTQTSLPSAGVFNPNANGSNTATVTATDAAGNTSSATNLAFTIDTTANAPTVNVVAGNDIINAAEQTSAITGTAEANATVTVNLGGVNRVVTANAAGVWTYTITPTDITNMGQNSETITVSYVDAAGNASPSVAHTISIDTIAPNLSIVGGNAVTTNDTTPTFSGAVEAGSTVQITLPDGSVQNAVVIGTSWSFTPATAINSGAIIVAATDAAGNTAVPVTQAVTIAPVVLADTTPPTASISVADTLLGSGETTVVTVTFSEPVTGFSNADVTYPVTNGTLGAFSTADGGTTWTATFTPTPGITAATNVFTLGTTYTDIAGNAGTGAVSVNYAIDTASPTPTISITSSSGADNTYVAGNVITLQATYGENVTVTGTPVMALTIGGQTVYATYISGSGTGNLIFTYTVQAGQMDANGIDIPANAITGSIADAAGNAATNNASLVVGGGNHLVDTLAPSTPIITAQTVSNDTTPVVSGTAEAGSTVTVTIGGATYTTVATGGNWSIDTGSATPTSGAFTAIANGSTGSYAVTATATDVAGNTSTGASATVAIDAQAPTVTSITTTTPDGAYNAGDTVNFTATLSEPATAGQTFTITLGTGGAGDTITMTVVAGGLTATGSYLVGAGDNAADLGVTAIGAGTVTDASGNGLATTLPASGFAGNHAIVIDTTAPTLSGIALAGDADKTAAEGAAGTGVTTLTAEAGSTVTVTYTNAMGFSITTAAQTSAGTALTFGLTAAQVAALGQGAITVSATATDAAGNVTTLAGASAGFTLDTRAPTITSVTIVNAPADHNYAVGSDPLVQVSVTFSEAVTFTGNPTIDLNIGGTIVQATYNSTTGYFEFTITSSALFDTNGLAVVANSLTLAGGATIVDAAGNAAVMTHAGVADHLDHTVGKEVHTIVGSVDTDANVAAYLGISLSNGTNPALGTGSTALLSGGNRLWAGDDSVTADAGNDIIFIYAADAGGNDTIDGGAGTDDVIIYDDIRSAITVDLSGPVQTVNLGALGNETLSGIEAFILGLGNDVFVGGTDAITVLDRQGNDTITGSTSDDVISDLDHMADVINGGAGTDTLQYNWDLTPRSDGITVTLSASGTTVDSDGNTLSGIENLELSNFDDNAVGSSAANQINAGNGADTLDGGAGDDTVDAGNGDDYVRDSDLNQDNLSGSSGSDTVDFSGLDTTQGALGGIGLVIDLAHNQTALASTPTTQIDTISGFEHVIGTAASDTITGNSDANMIVGGDGSDYIDGYLGNDTLLAVDGFSDTLQGGGGADSIVGDALDYASYQDASTGVSVNLQNNNAGYGISSDGDSIYNINNLIGSGLGDTLIGNNLGNILFGGERQDVLDGGSGDDTIYAGADNDTVYAGLGADTLFGGNGNGTASGDDLFILTDDGSNDSINGEDGINTVDYSSASGGVRINIQGTGAGTATEASGSVDTLINIQNVYGSAFNDTILGSNNAGNLFGGDGNDSIVGGAADHYIDGGRGNDTIIMGTGNNSESSGDGDDLVYITNFAVLNDVHGDAGSDTISFERINTALNGGGLSISLSTDLVFDATGTSIQTNLYEFENVVGTDANDTIFGQEGTGTSADNNILVGGLGADLIYGLGGNDTLIGDDDGGSSSDTLVGGDGADELLGDSSDYASYEDYATGISVNLQNNGVFGIASDGDRLYGINNVIGSREGDTLIGNDRDNVIYGGDGDDSIVSAAGNDGIVTGDGANTVYAGDGDDRISAGRDADWIDAGADRDEINAGDGDNTIYGGDGDDRIRAGSGADTINGDQGRDYIEAGDGANTIDGGNDEDTMIGGRYSNVFYLGADGAADTLDGSASRNNTLDYSQVTTEAFRVILSDETAVEFGTGATDTLFNIQNVTGGSMGDELRSSRDTNILRGGGGNDEIFSYVAGGNDSYYGEDGNDVITVRAYTTSARVLAEGGNGNDFISAVLTGGGDFTLDGGENGVLSGSDTVNFTGHATISIDANTGSGYGTTNAGDGFRINALNFDHYLFDVGVVSFTGSRTAEYLGLQNNPTSSSNSVDLGDGNDTLAFSNLDNSFTHTMGGSSTYDGGIGIDVLDLSALDAIGYKSGFGYVYSGVNLYNSVTGISVNLGAFNNFEHVILGVGNDDFYGSNDANSMIGGAGNDTLYGGSGSDSLLGGEGNDTLEGGADADYIDGGAGINGLIYHSTSITGINLSLSSNIVEGGEANGDTLVGLFNNAAVYGNTNIVANGNNNYLIVDLGFTVDVQADSGNDTIYSTVYSGINLSGVNLHGGNDVDTLSLNSSVAGTSVYNFSTATLASIESLQLSGRSTAIDTYVLSASQVLNMSETNVLEIFASSGSYNLTVQVTGSGYTLMNSGTVSDNYGHSGTVSGAGLVTLGTHTFYAYQSGIDYLLIENGVDTRLIS